MPKPRKRARVVYGQMLHHRLENRGDPTLNARAESLCGKQTSTNPISCLLFVSFFAHLAVPAIADRTSQENWRGFIPFCSRIASTHQENRGRRGGFPQLEMPERR
jgi:hypothetical protein